MKKSSLWRELSEKLRGKILLMGVGNPLRSDDGAGPSIINALQGKVNANILDAGDVPENYMDWIKEIKPDTILIVDIAYFGGSPGEIILSDSENINTCHISTHGLPLSVLTKYISNEISCKVFFLFIQPQTLEIGGSISAAVRKSMDEIVSILRELPGISITAPINFTGYTDS